MSVLNTITSRLKYIFILGIACACESFVDVDLTETLVTSDKVFSNDITATSAVTGIYHDMLDVESYASGSDKSITALTGFSSDELVSYSMDANSVEFYANDILPENTNVLSLWKTMYKSIYEANSVIEGIEKSNSLSPGVRSQLLGEARFVRAFSYFYLVNLFGPVPLITATDYRINATLDRTDIDLVYNQIDADLDYAESNLAGEYVTGDRARPNKYTAIALRARVSLYMENWSEAERLSSLIIENEMYSLEDIGNVFTKDSKESIWQLKPISADLNTLEGYFFILTSSPYVSIGANALSNSFVESFEPGDRRHDEWIGVYTEGNDSWYYPYKYKIQSGSILSEYSIVFRVAEQYLIRAEARARQNNLSGAIQDLDTLRYRAGLPSINDLDDSIDEGDFLLAVEQERKSEYFSEWGHRWSDLKRYQRAEAVLGSIKSGWSMDDILYPIPQSERNKNPNLGNQNPGY